MPLRLRALFTWKVFRRLLIALAILVVLLIAAGFEENWRGKRDWDAYVAAHQAANDPIDFPQFIPPPVPDDQNFAMIPLLAPIFPKDPSSPPNNEYAESLTKKWDFPTIEGKESPGFGDPATGKHLRLADWRLYLDKDILEWLKQYDGDLAGISKASLRKYSRFPLDYEKVSGINTPHIPPLGALAGLFELRACAEIRAGQMDRALEDARAIFRLSDSIKDEPVLASRLARLLLWRSGLQVVWEGLGTGHWTDAQLAILQEDLSRPDFLSELQRGFRIDRGSFNSIVDEMSGAPQNSAQADSRDGTQYSTRLPKGIFCRMRLDENLFFEKYLFNIVDVPARRLRMDVIAAGENYMENLRPRRILGVPICNYYEVLTAIAVPPISGFSGQFAYTQARTDQALVACALERYRLANGQFPDTLDKIVPAYLKAIPLDVINGKPPHYLLYPNGTYELYTDGWNGADDGGEVILKDDHIDIEKSDWVWSFKPVK